MALELVKGNTGKVTSTVYTDNGVTKANLTGATIVFVAKRNADDVDADAVFSKSVGSGITILTQSGATLGQCETVIAAADTNSVTQSRLFYELLVKLSTGEHIRTGAEELQLEGNVRKVLT